MQLFVLALPLFVAFSSEQMENVMVKMSLFRLLAKEKDCCRRYRMPALIQTTDDYCHRQMWDAGEFLCTGMLVMSRFRPYGGASVCVIDSEHFCVLMSCSDNH